MGPDPDTILQAALQLSEAQRISLVSQLIDSLPVSGLEIFEDIEFQQELERRASDSTATIPWAQVHDEL